MKNIKCFIDALPSPILVTIQKPKVPFNCWFHLETFNINKNKIIFIILKLFS